MTSPCPAPSHRGHTITYAHRLNGRDYSFAFELVDMRTAEGWRLYILDQPGYGQWADGCHETHRTVIRPGQGARRLLIWTLRDCNFPDHIDTGVQP